MITSRGLDLDSNFNSAGWSTSCKGLSALKLLNKQCGDSILFRSVEDAKIEASSESIPIFIHQTGFCQYQKEQYHSKMPF